MKCYEGSLLGSSKVIDLNFIFTSGGKLIGIEWIKLDIINLLVVAVIDLFAYCPSLSSVAQDQAVLRCS